MKTLSRLRDEFTKAEVKVKEEEDKLVRKGKNVEELIKNFKELTKKVEEAGEEQNPAAAIAAHKRARPSSAEMERQKA
jgi:hypothetical protein